MGAATAGRHHVRNEAWLPDHQRRADVRIVFEDGQQLALEVQASPLTDQEWLRRHNDYLSNGIIDLWIWHPDLATNWGPLAAPDGAQQLWTMDPDRRSLSLMVAKPHSSASSQAASEEDVVHYVRHLPPCIGDELVAYALTLDELDLTSRGISIPGGLRRALTVELQHERERRARVQHLQPKPTRPMPPSAVVPASRPQHSSTTTQSVSPPPVDSAARSQSAWLQLQNAFMAAGHSFEYRDAPRGFDSPVRYGPCPASHVGLSFHPPPGPTKSRPACLAKVSIASQAIDRGIPMVRTPAIPITTNFHSSSCLPGSTAPCQLRGPQEDFAPYASDGGAQTTTSTARTECRLLTHRRSRRIGTATRWSADGIRRTRSQKGGFTGGQNRNSRSGPVIDRA
ncbi:competence protein CoiA family protein [Nocardia asiatica]|uniref:competence protein CoiA family protein n=1 Tax=Nocardia asiatica TaxID=209252 RepID=UPI003F5BE107